MYLQWLSGVSRGTAGANPNFQLPDWMLKAPGRVGELARGIQWNATHGGTGNPPTGFGLGETGGYPYQANSGPGAAYGPAGGPLHGLLDQGNPNVVDVTEDPTGGQQPPGPPQKPKGHGGGGSAAPNFFFSSPGGIGYKPSFVAWQPIPYGQSAGAPPTQFVSPGGRAVPSNAAPAPAPPQVPSAPPGRPGGHPKGGGKGKPPAPGKTPPGAPGGPPGPGSSGGPILPPDSGFTPGQGGGRPSNPFDRKDPTFSGYNPNTLDKATPGWIYDPTTGINNTAGFPGATPPSPQGGETWDDYYNQLRDLGLNQDTIGSLLGPYGYTRGPGKDGQWSWGWGTGPVVGGPMDPQGYHYANTGMNTSGAPPWAPPPGSDWEMLARIYGAPGAPSGQPAGPDPLDYLFGNHTPAAPGGVAAAGGAGAALDPGSRADLGRDWEIGPGGGGDPTHGLYHY
jgi:hypothetical protein